MAELMRSAATPSLPESRVVISPARNISGVLRMPGDKSISHRYAMLAAIAEGTSRLRNYSTGQDCASTLSCLGELGCEWKRDSEGENTIMIEGLGPKLQHPGQPLNCGNSG